MLNVLYHFNNFNNKIIWIVWRDDMFDQKQKIKIDFHYSIRKKPLHE